MSALNEWICEVVDGQISNAAHFRMPCKISAPYLAQQREKANTGCLCYSHNLPQSATAWQCLAGVPGKCFKINSISVNCLEQLSGPMLAPVLSVPLTQVWLDSVARLLRLLVVCVPSVFASLPVCACVCVCLPYRRRRWCCCCYSCHFAAARQTEHKLLAKH